MDLKLDDKVALVTGSSDGIGAGIARTLAEEGAAVVVHGRNAAKAKLVLDEIRKAGGRVAVVLGDLAKDEDARRVAKEAEAAFGRIDILVNNVGVFPQKPWLETTAADWNELYNQNVTSMVRMVNALVPAMRERGWGRVIQIASAAATKAIPGMGNYAVTKAANVMVSASLAQELGTTGVTVNTVSPGPILTPGVKDMIAAMAPTRGWSDDWAERERRFLAEFAPTLTGKIGHPEDVASLVAWLASPLARNVTGSNFRTDGGFLATVN